MNLLCSELGSHLPCRKPGRSLDTYDIRVLCGAIRGANDSSLDCVVLGGGESISGAYNTDLS